MAEEGLDVPECNLVVRFDLCKTAIQFVQSRGRARMKTSIFAHMMEQGNDDHHSLVWYVKDAEEYLGRFCSLIPEDRLLGQKHVSLERVMLREGQTKIFTTSSGAKCNFYNCLLILSRYTSSLQYANNSFCDADFELDIDGESKLFKYQVILPPNSGFGGAWGEWHPNKMLAKRSAAWETCFILRAKKLLDENLDSVHRRQRVENANARLAISSQKEEYEMKIKPDFWALHCGFIPDLLFATIIHLFPSNPLNRLHRPIVIFTRDPLPALPVFPVFLEASIETSVSLERVLKPFRISEQHLEMMTIFTTTIYADIFNKSYERNSRQMGYWLAPYRSVSSNSCAAGIQTVVDVDFLEQVYFRKGQRVPWTPGTSADKWLGRFLVDRWSGAYRYFSLKVVPNATKDSPVPPAVKPRPGGSKNIMDYTLSLYRNSKNVFIEQCDKTQPVLETELIQLRRNFLDKTTENERDSSDYVQVVPEPLELSLLDIGTVSTCLVFPAIMFRMDSYLIALEAFEMLNLTVSAGLALEALTKDSDNTEEHHEQQIHFQRGMGKNYERLEFIGDSLLKMTTTIMVFIRQVLCILFYNLS